MKTAISDEVYARYWSLREQLDQLHLRAVRVRTDEASLITIPNAKAWSREIERIENEIAQLEKA